jgi:hypothetical protein
MAEVHSIRYKNRLRGILEGAGLGLFAGAAGGSLLGAATFDEPNIIVQTAWDAVAFGALGLGLLGTPIGELIGVVRGSHIVYEVQGPSVSDPSTSTHTPSAAEDFGGDRGFILCRRKL